MKGQVLFGVFWAVFFLVVACNSGEKKGTSDGEVLPDDHLVVPDEETLISDEGSEEITEGATEEESSEEEGEEVLDDTVSDAVDTLEPDEDSLVPDEVVEEESDDDVVPDAADFLPDDDAVVDTGSCKEIMECSQACGNDSACVGECYDAGSPEGKAAFNALVTCVNANCGMITDPDERAACIMNYCGDELAACGG